MNTHLDCDGVRVRLMASIDGEPDATPEDRRHASTCAACRQWLSNFESLRGRLQNLAYPETTVDVWPAVQGGIETSDRATALVHQLWPIGAVVLGWRALQLFIDLPMPALHPLVPLVAAVAVAWRLGGDLLQIETFAPELRKRGV